MRGFRVVGQWYRANFKHQALCWVLLRVKVNPNSESPKPTLFRTATPSGVIIIPCRQLVKIGFASS